MCSDPVSQNRIYSFRKGEKIKRFVDFLKLFICLRLLLFFFFTDMCFSFTSLHRLTSRHATNIRQQIERKENTKFSVHTPTELASPSSGSDHLSQSRLFIGQSLSVLLLIGRSWVGRREGKHLLRHEPSPAV